MNEQLIRLTNNVLAICESLDKKYYIEGLNYSVRQLLQLDFVKLMKYAKQSSHVTIGEREFLAQYLGVPYSDNSISDSETGNEYANSMPYTFLITLKDDKAHNYSPCLSEIMVDFFHYVGEEYLNHAGYATQSGRNALDTRITALQSFISSAKERQLPAVCSMVHERPSAYTPIDNAPNNANGAGWYPGASTVGVNNTNGAANPANQYGAAPNQPAAPTAQQPAAPEKTMDELMAELNELVGLAEVKQNVNSLINLIRIRKIRQERGIKQPDMSLHLVFSGNPGTGKTTVARLLAQIYRSMGLLSKGQLTEVDRSGLVGGYVGQTALKVHDVVEKARGGILFVDEAYALTVNRGETDFGFEAVDTLLKAMEDYRDDFIVIVAGYPELMEEFLASNPGLRSRFNRFIFFEDYIAPELYSIFEGMCKKSSLQLSPEAQRFAQTFFEDRYANRDDNYANARDVRNFFERALINQANRLSIDDDIDDSELAGIELADLNEIEL